MENLIGVFQACFPSPLFALYASTGAKSHYWGQYTACGRWLKEQSLCKTQLPTTGDLWLSEMKCLVHLFQSEHCLHLSPLCGQSLMQQLFFLCCAFLHCSPHPQTATCELHASLKYVFILQSHLGWVVLIAGQDKYVVVQIITGSVNKNKTHLCTNVLFSICG